MPVLRLLWDYWVAALSFVTAFLAILWGDDELLERLVAPQ